MNCETNSSDDKTDGASPRTTYDDLVSEIHDRTTCEEFRQLLELRQSLTEKAEDLDDLLRSARRRMHGGGTRRSSFVGVRDAVLEARPVHEALAVTNRKLDDFRAVTARLALRASMIRDDQEKRDGTFLTYDRDTIGVLKSSGIFDIGSRRWEEDRRNGIGGSDVAGIMRVGYGSYNTVLREKVEPFDGEDEERFDLRTPIGRGNAWEEYIRHMFSDRNPDCRVAFCKKSWSGDGGCAGESYRHANFDGLIVNPAGEALGVVEIKTGTDSGRWGPVEAGIRAVPPEYLVQVLWYTLNALLRRGVIVALLDDHDYREYWFDLDKDETLLEDVRRISEETEQFWNVVTQKRALLDQGRHDICPPRKGFTKTLNMRREAEHLALYNGETFEESYKKVREGFSKIKKPGTPCTRDEIQSVLTSLYCQYDPCHNNASRPFIGIDLETNSMSARSGRIIETGIVRLDRDGSLTTLYSSRHGLPESVIEGLGTGDERLHRISPDSLTDLPPFEDEETQRTILKILKGGILVAHNARFEDEFLTANLTGYAEARESGEIEVLDTMELTTRFMVDGADNTLKSFAEENGVPYVNAHAAWRDTEMMMEALKKFQEVMFTHGHFVPSPVSQAHRDLDTDEARLWEKNVR